MTSERDYPTDSELKEISEWPTTDLKGWFDFIESIWWMADWGIRKTNGKIYMSTGGWSGNESIIGAMMENFILWGRCWQSSRRGGHYVFEMPKGKVK